MKDKKHILTPQEREHKEDLLVARLRDYKEVLFAYLYGSFSEGLPFNDIDVGVYLAEEGLSPAEILQYEIEKGIELELLIGLPVDLQVLNHAPLPLRYHISQGQLLFSRDEPARYTFLETTWRDYFDYYPLVRQFYHDITAMPAGNQGKNF
ncbi:nucleotidyltransferase domain-containing protein [Moorella sp. Hama-1]|uniref:nucleotidyltransferase domain-containing protein n=1 Tax=Moorella sp. Hama-1 TaxID=2138101 RepID=UPI000D655A92|nr:nucleotidyltransferase domain-containing protein [Moorella sp. Hama-1]BCV22633.1 nucleotidyltransferase [Moorella sp. Hama-1]